jgi:voltage-gated potassium channel
MTNPIKKVLFVGLLTLIVLAIGIVGFMSLEGWSFLDALYMTVITVTTVGYFEVRPLSPEARVFNIVFIMLGVGIILSIFGTVWQITLEGRIQALLGRRRLEKEIRNLKDHYIVCGFGRVGKIICREIKDEGRPLVVIEKDTSMLAKIEELKIPYIIGDATEEKILREAGLEQARGLVSCLLKDADNVYICLTAREIRPDIFILSRAGEPDASKRLQRAGASRVVSPHYMGARKMAQELLRPAITNFVEIVFQEGAMELNMEELRVGSESQLYNVTLKDSGIRQELDLIIVAIMKNTGEMLYNPRFDALVEIGDTLIAMGRKENLLKLAHKLGSPRH